MRRGSKQLVLTILSIAICAALVLPGAQAEPTQVQAAQAGAEWKTAVQSAKPEKLAPESRLPANYRPGEVIVKFKPGVSAARLNQAKAESGIASTKKRLVPRRGKDSEIQLAALKPNVSVEEAIKRLKSRRIVEYAEPNYFIKPLFVPNDTYFDQQWGLPKIKAPEAWDIEQGYSNPVTVAVIDTGIDLNHPDLLSKLWVNPGEIPDNDIDDDANGYVDDVHGYNFGANIYQVNDFTSYFLGSDSPDPIISDFAQSITGNGEIVYAIGLEFFRFGNPSSGIRVSIRSSLAGPDIAYYDISPSEISSTEVSYIEKALSSSVTLSAGSTYYIVAHTDVRDYYNSYAIYGWIDSYSGGIMHKKLEDSWIDDPIYDLAFVADGTGPDPSDDYGHGTHVSGIVGAAANNNTGVAGVSPGAEIMAVRAGGEIMTDFSVAMSVYYAADNDAKVLNMSLGGTYYSITLEDATTYAHNNGAVVAAAAGNDYGTVINYPAGNNYVIGVGATDSSDKKANFSNRNSSVDVAAPGVDVYSTMPTYHVELNDLGYSQDYSNMSGTSMATPHVAGLAALIFSQQPGLTPDQVEQLIGTSADDLGSPGRDDFYGYGRINAYAALSTADTTAPGITSLQPPDSSIVGKLKPIISAAYSDSGSGIDSATAAIYLDGADKTSEASVTAESISYIPSVNLSEGLHAVKVTVNDNAGNYAEANWQFSILEGDINGDGTVNILDLVIIGQAFGSIPTSPNWNADADLNGDNQVNILDLVTAGINFGQSL